MNRGPGASRGIVAVVLAAGVAAALVIITAAAAWALIDRNNTVPEHIASLLTTGFGALIGALSVYLGGRGSAPTGEVDSRTDDDTGSATDRRGGHEAAP